MPNIVILLCWLTVIPVEPIIDDAEISITPPAVASVDQAAVQQRHMLCFEYSTSRHDVSSNNTHSGNTSLQNKHSIEKYCLLLNVVSNCGSFLQRLVQSSPDVPILPVSVCAVSITSRLLLPSQLRCFLPLLLTHIKPSVCFSFACNPYSACSYNTLHLTTQQWDVLLLWEGLPMLLLVVDIYYRVSLPLHVVVPRHNLVKVFRLYIQCLLHRMLHQYIKHSSIFPTSEQGNSSFCTFSFHKYMF